MSATTRSRLDRQSNGRPRERNPASLIISDSNPAEPALRSRRLRHDDVDATEAGLPPEKRRRKSQKSKEGEDVEDTTVERTSGRTVQRVESPRNAAKNSRRTSKKHTADAQPSHELDRPRRRGRPRLGAVQTRDDAPAEVSHPDDIYDIPVSPTVRQSQAGEVFNAHQQDDQDSDGSKGLFVRQERDGDEEPDDEPDEEPDEESDDALYDEPTGMQAAAPEDGGPREQAAPAEEQQAAAAFVAKHFDRRSLVVNLAPEPRQPSAEPAEGEYPDDHFIFNAPTGHDRVTEATLRTAALKYMVELMNTNGWKRTSVIGTTPHKDLRSNWNRQFWDTIVQLKDFWENIPWAPQFDEQCDYIHADDETALAAQEAVLKVDEFVNMTVERSKKTTKGFDEMMYPKPFTVDLYERIIPILVETIHGVFKTGVGLDQPSWRGRFTKPILQIMERLLAWVETLYLVMTKSLEKRPRGQKQVMIRNRQKLAALIKELEAEFKATREMIDEAPQRMRLRVERIRLAREREERERHAAEERKRRQRELCDSRIAERVRRIKTCSPQSQPSLALATSQQDARRPDTSQAQSTMWPDEEAKRLLTILKEKPRVDPQHFSWVFQRSIEEVRDMVELLKQSARTYAASRNKSVPEFATI